MIKHLLLSFFVFLLTSTPSVHAALPGARSATVSGDVFLGGDYIELGISQYGSFGTDANKPSGFFGTAARNNIGMSSDLDGFDTGTDWRMDFFMPGTQEERWSIGYKIGGVSTTTSNARRANTTNITNNTVTNQSSGDNLKATSVGSYASNLEITQVISFTRADKFFKTVVTLKNIGASTLDSVRYMRSFDPDNTVDKGGSYTTRNKIVYTHAAGDGKAAVSADTSNSASDPVYTGTGGASGGTRSPIFFYSSDTRARVGHHSGLNPGNVYTAAVYDSVPAKDNQADRDGAISIAFDVGTLSPGASQSFTFYTSLDNRDFSEVEEQIQQDEAASSAPVISNIIATPSATSVNIAWTTDSTSSSQVEYGLVPEYGFTTAETDTSPRLISHQVAISSLKQCARYFYRVISKNASNQSTTSTQNTFKTSGCVISSISGGSEKDITATAGGSLSYTNGNSTARLSIPANFHNATASFQINKLVSDGVTAPESKGLIAGNIFDLIAVNENDEKINSFDNSVSFIVEYSDSDISGYDENTLDVYKYNGSSWEDKNCTLNTAANTLTCSLSSFSVYGVFGQSPASASSGTGSSSSPGPETCNLAPPVSAPDLFQIDRSGSEAKTYFTPVSKTNTYYLSYSQTSNAESYGVTVNLGSEGVQNYTIKDLDPNATYYFKVRGQNGCMPGPWSNIKISSVKASIATPTEDKSDSAELSLWTKPVMEITEVKTESVNPNSCTYTVAKGDNLWKIAEKEYSDGSLYKKIIEDNKTKYPTASKGLEVGWQLQMTCKDESKTTADIKQEYQESTSSGEVHDVLVKIVHKGQPLAGAEVEIPEITKYGVTNENGEVLFKSVPKGEKLFKLVHDVYAAEQKIKVDGEERQFNISISVELKKSVLAVPWWLWLILIILFGLVIYLYRKLNNKENKTRPDSTNHV